MFPSPYPLPLLHWTSMEELQEIICELGIKHAIYGQHFRGPDEELFPSGMKGCVLQLALGTWYGALVPSLAPVVKSTHCYSSCYNG